MQGQKKRMIVLMLIGILVISTVPGCKSKEDGLTLEEIRSEEQVEADEAPDDQNADEGNEETGQESEGTICVFVCGQVACPGVYELAAGSRIYQAVEAAGGVLETADDAYVNQAEMLEDGQRIYIPSADEVRAGEVEEAKDGGSDSEAGITSDGHVNLNTASKEELMTLSGIGEKKAEAIIQYRDTNGGFQTTEELMQVPGIKEGTFEKIKEDIVV